MQAVSDNKRYLWNVGLVLLVWTAFGIFFGTQSYVRDVYSGKTPSLPGYIVSWTICGYAWGLLTYPVLVFARRFTLGRLGWPLFLLVHVPAAFVFAAAQLATYLLIAKTLFGGGGRGAWEFYAWLVANELQASLLVYSAMVAAITIYDRFFKPEQIREIEHTASVEVPEIAPPHAANGNGNGTNGFLRRVPVKENGKIVLVDADRIDWVESYGNYLFLHTAGRKFIHRETVAAMEKKLDPHEFVRIRRSTIVRIDRIRELHPGDNGEFEVVLEGGTVLFSTRRYRKNLESVLKP